MSGDELRGENVAALLREYADSHPSRRVLLSAAETRALLDERDALRAQVERVRALAESWRSLPVWGPDERGLMILDYVDHEGIMRDLNGALDGAQ